MVVDVVVASVLLELAVIIVARKLVAMKPTDATEDLVTLPKYRKRLLPS